MSVRTPLLNSELLGRDFAQFVYNIVGLASFITLLVKLASGHIYITRDLGRMQLSIQQKTLHWF